MNPRVAYPFGFCRTKWYGFVWLYIYFLLPLNAPKIPADSAHAPHSHPQEFMIEEYNVVSTTTTPHMAAR